jgi:hypothetical protein
MLREELGVTVAGMLGHSAGASRGTTLLLRHSHAAASMAAPFRQVRERCDGIVALGG